MSVEVSKTSWAEIIALSYIYSNEKSKYPASNKLHNTLAKWQSSTPPLTCLSVDTQVANILIHLYPTNGNWEGHYLVNILAADLSFVILLLD